MPQETEKLPKSGSFLGLFLLQNLIIVIMSCMDNLQLTEMLTRILANQEKLQASYDSLVQEHELLKSKYATLVEFTEKIVAERDALKQRVAELEATNQRLTAMLFGRRGERRINSPEQGMLFDSHDVLTEEEQAVVVAQEAALELSDKEIVDAYHNRQKQQKPTAKRSEKLPEHLERRDTIVDLPDGEKVGLRYIGDSITERLKLQCQVLFVERLIQRQYAIKNNSQAGIKCEPLPLNFVAGSKYDFSVVAMLLSQKFGWHIPTYRGQDIFAGCGWAPSRSSINDLFNQADVILAPLFKQMKSLILKDSIVLGDDTTVRLLTRDSLDQDQEQELELRRQRKKSGSDKGNQDKPGIALSYAWIYNGLDDGAPYNLFHWTLGRSQKTVQTHLGSFQGTLVGDAFGGNVRLAKIDSGIQFAACNAHARREFLKAEKTATTESSQAIAFYKRLYDIEARAKELSPEARQQLRMSEAKPLWERFRQWLDGIPPSRRLPKSPLGKAVTYMNNQWKALTLYLENGRIPIDNSQSERAIRPLTIGRKNWMFLGHPRAAESRLRLFSIVSSANRHHLMLDRYLEYVLRELSWAKQHSPTELMLDSDRLLRCLPNRWAAANPDSIRQFRREEQADQSERSRYVKARRRIDARLRRSQESPRAE